MAAKPRDLGKKVNEFIRFQMRKRWSSPQRDQTLKDLVEQQPLLDVGQVDLIINQALINKKCESPLAEEVREIFHDAIKGLNHFNKMRRLFAVQTINFLADTENLRDLIEHLLFSQRDTRRKIAMDFIRAFKGTDRVISVLTSKQELFNQNMVDSYIHALYSFRYELAEQLLGLFLHSYIKQKSQSLKIDANLALDFFRLVLKSSSQEELEENLLPTEQLPAALARVVAFTQSHKMMPIYAKKRYDYLKEFFKDLVRPGRLPGVEPADLSKICACFINSNQQLAPPLKLIRAMVDAQKFDQEEWLQAKNAFLDKLAPVTLDAVLRDVRDFLDELFNSSHGDLEAAFAKAKNKLAQGQEDDSLLGRMLGFLLEFKAVGMMVLAEVEEHLLEIRSSYLKMQQAQEPGLEELFNEACDLDGVQKASLVPKQAQCQERLARYMAVSTSLVGFKGEAQAPPKRAKQSNQFLFASAELRDNFKEALRQLMLHLDKDSNKVVSGSNRYPQSPKPLYEYHVSFLIPQSGEDPQLFCLGISYFEKDFATEVSAKGGDPAEALLDPYCFLMGTSVKQGAAFAKSRKVVMDEQDQEQLAKLYMGQNLQNKGFRFKANLDQLEFKAQDMGSRNLLEECGWLLLDLLHSLPEKNWNSPEVQYCVVYLAQLLRLEL